MENFTNKNFIDQNDQEILETILKDQKVMTEITYRSIRFFFYIFFNLYIRCKMAPFHLDFFKLAQDDSLKRIGVIAFRNSAKSSILNTAYALWAIMGVQKKKHVIIASQTQQRARDHLKNIRDELEKNELLRKLMGPFEEEKSDKWNTSALIIPKYEARISAVSTEEGLRGLREGPYRPDLIIADDIEDTSSVRTKESRDKTFSWLTRELFPLGDADTKIVLIGNFVHKDSALTKIERLINSSEMKGVFLKIPIIDDESRIAWPGMFSNHEVLEEFRKNIGNDESWHEEFLLKPFPKGVCAIKPEWIKEYVKMPSFSSPDYHGTYIGIDPAISEDEGADNTAMVTASVFGHGENLNIYIHPDPINKRLSFSKIKECAKLLARTIVPGSLAIPIIEDVAAQKWLYDDLKQMGIYGELFKVRGIEKSVRFKIAVAQIEIGKVHFPKDRVKDLLTQLFGFGTERYDDLADAFSMVVIKIIEMETTEPAMLTITREECEKIKKNPNQSNLPKNLNDWFNLWKNGQQ